MEQPRWKKIHDDSWGREDHDLLHRLKVPGGYLYRDIFISRNVEHVSMTFVPVNSCKCCGYDLVYSCYNCNKSVVE